METGAKKTILQIQFRKILGLLKVLTRDYETVDAAIPSHSSHAQTRFVKCVDYTVRCFHVVQVNLSKFGSIQARALAGVCLTRQLLTLGP
jgi:hypothetical protein